MDTLNHTPNISIRRRLLSLAGSSALVASLAACGTDSPNEVCTNYEVKTTHTLDTLGELASVALTLNALSQSDSSQSYDIDSVGVMQFDPAEIDSVVKAAQVKNNLAAGTNITQGKTYVMPVCTE